MKDARLCQAVKQDYLLALGHATYCFALCEWQVVWCSDKLSPGSVTKFVGEKLEAGKIAKRFLDLTRNMPPSRERETLRSLATRFAELVKLRNQIVHGKPCTGPSGDSRLSAGDIIEIPDLEKAADDFSQCSIELNEQFYGFLTNYKPEKSG
jgi:hypothetical protein